MSIFITSDTHFGHDRDFLYKPRGFENIYDHDKKIIQNWNSVVTEEDEVYHLGDMMLGDNDYGLSCIKQLRGQIHLVRGNHDTAARMELYNKCFNIIELTEGQFFHYKKYHFYLSHYPSICGNHDDDKPLNRKTISLCGHTHTTDPLVDLNKGLIFHCELDGHNNTPWLLDDIIDILKKI